MTFVAPTAETHVTYANFWRLKTGATEIAIDFGQMMAEDNQGKPGEIVPSTRVVMTHDTFVRFITTSMMQAKFLHEFYAAHPPTLARATQEQINKIVDRMNAQLQAAKEAQVVQSADEAGKGERE